MRPIVKVALAAAVLPTLAMAQERQRPPAPLPLAEAQFPAFVEFELENGLRVVLVPSEKQPVLSMQLSVLAGTVFDPPTKSGLADLVSGLMTKGAGSRSADEIAETIERVGGSLSAAAGPDFLSVSASVLTTDRELAFELVADALLRPTFPADELDLLRTQTLSALALARSQPDAIAGRMFAKHIYGDHPYGRRADETSVRGITRADLIEFHRLRVRPAQGLLVLAGAIDSTEAHRLAQRAFGSWAGRGALMPPSRPAPQRQRTEIVLVHRPGSVQSNIMVGNTTWQPTDTRSHALAMANQVLGGASDARLFTILREEKGWTYGAYSDVNRVRGLGTFMATAEVRTEVTDSALVELLRQVYRMGAEPVPADEFERQQQTLTGRFPLTVETAQQVAAQVATSRLLGLPNDYVQTYRQRIAALTPEQVQAAARGGMRAEAALVVVVGDGAALKSKLEAIAPVTMVDVDGAPIAVEETVVRAVPLAFDPSALRATSDSFTVMVQGQNFGYQSFTLEPTADGWRFFEKSVLGPIIQQETTVEFTREMEMRSTTQSGRFQGEEMNLLVRYGGGRATGSGRAPGQQGMQEVSYRDATVPDGAVDDNLLVALLPFFAWRDGATVEVNVFLSGRGTVERRTLRVDGQEVVTVPAGTFGAYRVQLVGGDAAGTYWIEVAQPHRVLKFGPAGVPLEIVRVR
ncbi:MAG: insulinase family protein [Gemmatimonadaceae bacterium]|nr:insulinase family protein [Gemmatimonadaceae bacterium]MCW5825568.1 insulinase family protein [Gemmatimonadaceae bacterium]